MSVTETEQVDQPLPLLAGPEATLSPEEQLVTQVALPDSQNASPRTLALDILRGAAVLMMVFASNIPFDKPLPRWLYHAQEPPSYDSTHSIVHTYNASLAGLTFVDLVFPFFLFSLGAAIPLALTRKVQNGLPIWKAGLIGLQRLVLLAWFSLFLAHVRPEAFDDGSSVRTDLIAFTGFVLLSAMFTRLPRHWKPSLYWSVRAAGYGGAVVLLLWLSLHRDFASGAAFDVSQNDIILILLANMAFFGTVIWLATRDNVLMRLGVLVCLLAMRLAAPMHGLVQDVWNYSLPFLGWLMQWEYLKYLFIVIPGTIAGDLLYQWMQNGDEVRGWIPRLRLVTFVALSVALLLCVLCGLERRWLWETSVLVFAACGAATWLLAHPTDSAQRLARSLVQWGVYWLVLGMLFEPYEGGIKKDPSTMSYYFVASGLALFLLASLVIVTTLFHQRRSLSLLADAGQNPMVAYCAMNNLILPLFALVHLDTWLGNVMSSEWLGVLLGALETLLLAYVVRGFTRRGMFWRT